MRKRRFAVFGIMLCFLLLFCVGAQAEEASEDGTETMKIGVVVYDPDSSEMSMFSNYYRDYIQEGFPVQFFFSGAVATAEEENQFIEAAKEQGAEGIISFCGYDLESTLAVCAENELYYVLGSGIVADEAFDAVKDNPWFLGSVGPDPADVYQTGVNMAEYFLEKGAKSYVIMTGGASRGNATHASRVEAMLETFSEQAGLVLDGEASELAAAEVNTTLTSADGSMTVTLVPDYTENGAGLQNLEEAFAAGNCDALMSAFHASTYLDKIAEKEAAQGSNIMVGAIDSFTEENFEAIKTKDSFGNPPIDYVEGKYASMAGPAFAMLYNAVSGYPEANSEDGGAIRLYQGFWVAKSREEYIELYGYTTGIYENAYSCEDLMQVIRVFNEEASPQALKELTEAYTVEDVKARIVNG
ncbi:hypothetical protein BRYFOR_06887 [Marvinbryantia formatexigens DSM 14469]|uniref:Periplasmic binding protein domain-containing protein n=1 Tax=Marvinbryantia formatexigens DSM 14469 TaxID=478749 RepID=C6LE38_9FIRM|nr:hypothetical protein [Marvinbryantia formatexigens]EET61242.1 hypothetical protein BRYFOR_06887 [Marvinbryantia formatexigens DSM 14469]UWO23789.1 hypothetical protein NQ534_15265 [Marvinbryantia formatexigens DSM 14469]SDF70966.1 hypothetical protein SAMN05660368_01188 [Marvinbryantia formatexigens]